MSQTNKKGKAGRVSIGEVPFSAAEKRELQDILDKPYWARRTMKDTFANKNRRLIGEVDEYIKMSGKLKGRAKKSTTTEKAVIRTHGTIKRSKTAVIRVPIGSVKAGETLRFEILFLK